MNDNIDKNLNMENLDDEELEQVSGGTTELRKRYITLAPFSLLFV